MTKKKRFRYLCLTETGRVRAIVSSREIDLNNQQQIDWINRECEGKVIKMVFVSGEKNANRS